MPAKSKPGSQQPNRDIAEIIRSLVLSVCLSVDVFLHRRIGSRYIFCGFGAVLVMYLFAINFQPEERLPLFWFMGAYTAWWFISLICCLVRGWRKQDKEHSGYTGEPLVARWLPGWREEWIKQVEALAVILLGLVLHRFTHPLADYLIFAASLVFLRVRMLIARQREQAILMSDMVVEQKAVAELFRARQ